MRAVTITVLTGLSVLAACNEPAAPREALGAEVAPTIRIIDLGTINGGATGAAYGISPNGLIVGSSANVVPGSSDPVIWSHGVIGQLGGTDAEAYGVRFDGTAVGYSLALGRAIDWSGGQATLLPLLHGGDYNIARAISPEGLIVGQGNLSLPSGEKRAHAVLWKNGVAKDLGTLGGRESEAFALNQSGNVVGSSQVSNGDKHAFLWKNGVMSELRMELATGCPYSEAFGINDSSYIVGAVCSGAAQWKHGKVINLGKLPGDLTSVATGINRSGDIVGWSGEGVCVPGTRAFLWKKGVMTDLGTLPGGDFSVATAISVAGEIVGYSTAMTSERTCQFHAVKWVVK